LASFCRSYAIVEFIRLAGLYKLRQLKRKRRPVNRGWDEGPVCMSNWPIRAGSAPDLGPEGVAPVSVSRSLRQVSSGGESRLGAADKSVTPLPARLTIPSSGSGSSPVHAHGAGAVTPIPGVKNGVRSDFASVVTGLQTTFSLLTLTSLKVR